MAFVVSIPSPPQEDDLDFDIDEEKGDRGLVRTTHHSAEDNASVLSRVSMLVTRHFMTILLEADRRCGRVI